MLFTELGFLPGIPLGRGSGTWGGLGGGTLGREGVDDVTEVNFGPFFPMHSED